MKYAVVLFIGRFQPFHNGHLYSLKKSLELAEKVIIGIGSSQELGTKSNPWSYEQRKKVVEAVVEIEKMGSRVEKIIPIPDYPSDEEWLKDTVLKAGIKEEEGVVVVSNNEWTLRVFRDAGYPVVESGLFNRDELEGVKIRALMRANNEDWKLRVPKVVAREIDMSVIKTCLRRQEGNTFSE